MDDPSLAAWFVGNLGDPWVAAIADALPFSAPARRINAPGDLPDGCFEDLEFPARIVLHRSVLTRHDFQRVARWRGRLLPGSRVILCFGPHVRHSELGQWSEIVDVAIPEATALETVANHCYRTEPAALPRSLRPRSRIGVVSRLFSLREAIADTCEVGGFTVSKASALNELPAGMTAVWDVPTLEPSWAGALEARAKEGPVIALLSFADRALVTAARHAGAVACLDLPLDIAEIPGVIDRVGTGTRRTEPPHELPPAPAYSKRSAGSERVLDPRFGHD